MQNNKSYTIQETNERIQAYCAVCQTLSRGKWAAIQQAWWKWSNIQSLMHVPRLKYFLVEYLD